jgi:DNA polymerase/3'-5' exonuclease PolX
VSSATTRMARAEADAIAQQFVRAIADACDQVFIAGSLRRAQPTVGDIEIVAVPKVETRMAGLFRDEPVIEDRLAARLEYMLIGGDVRKRRSESGATAWGPKHKRLVFEGAPVDLFCADADRLGVILAIRTGPADYSHALVSPEGMRLPGNSRLGMLPNRYRVQDGRLIYRVSGQPIPTPTERGFFDLIGVPYLEPQNRADPPVVAAAEGGPG